VQFKYSIPENLRGTAPRRNVFVPEEDRSRFIHSILSNTSPCFERNLAICSIIIDTGCRPIEITNLSLNDVNITEGTIYLTCEKSDERNLHLNKEVIYFLKDYLDIRNKIDLPHDKLFITQDCRPMHSNTITSVFHKYNLLEFGENRFSAYDLRHTFLTLALDHGVSLETAAKMMGHKIWASTLYYYNRNKEKLKSSLFTNNPLKGLEWDAH
jgi:site-specific recombinase XerD